MSQIMEKTRALRADANVHYNCCQATLIPFSGKCGIDEETAFRAGTFFNTGMRHGSTCGAVTGALMALGLAGAGDEAAKTLMREFREKNGCSGVCRAAEKGQGERGGAQVPLRPDGV